MAKNPNAGALLGRRAPEAAVHANVGVPHVGAQRRESQGDNYRRRASSYGRLAGALESFGAAWSQMEKAQKKSDYDTQWTQAVIADAPTAYSNPKSPEAQAAIDTQVAHGYDPRILKAQNLAELEKVTIPALREQAQKDLEGAAVAKFMYPTGRKVERFHEDGGRDEVDETRRLTTDDIKMMRMKEHKEVHGAYPLNSDEHVRMRVAAKTFVDQKYDTLEASLRDYTQKENREKVAGITRLYMPDNVKSLIAHGARPEDLFGKLQDEAMSVAETLGATRFNREHAGEVIIDGLDEAIAKGDAQIAQHVIDMYDRGRLPNGSKIASHGKYGSAFTTLYHRAATLKQKTLHEQRRIETISRAVEAMATNQRPFEELNIGDLETQIAGTKSPDKTSQEKLKKAIARELEAEILAPGGVEPEGMSEQLKTRRVIRGLKGTGLVSPALKARADALTLDYETDKERVAEAYSLYKELKDNQVGNIKQYFDDDRLKIMEDIEALQILEYDEAEAARLVYADRKGGDDKTFHKSMWAGELRDWQKKHRDEFTGEDMARIERVAKITSRGRQYAKASEVREALDSLGGVVAASKREVLGAPFEGIPGDDIDMSKAKVEFFMEHPLFKQAVPDTSKYRLEREDRGWRLVEKGPFGRTALHPATGNPVIITDSEVTKYWGLRQQLGEERQLSKAQKKLLETYGPNGARQLLQRIEADKRAEEEAYISP